MQNPQDKSALGMDGNVTALLGYFIWVIALILVFIEKENKFVRFHALQSVFLGIAAVGGALILYFVGIAIFLVGSMIGLIIDASIGIPIVTFIVMIISLLVFLLAIVAICGGFLLMIFAAIKAYSGSEFKIPFIGKLAEKYSG